MNRSVHAKHRLLFALLAAFFFVIGCGGAPLLQIKADAALQTKHYDEALLLYQEILKTDPNNAVALNGSGEAYLRMGKASDALPILEKAYQVDAGQRTIINLGLAYDQTGNYGKAITIWDILLAKDFDSNVAKLVRKHRLLALYKDADRHAKQALAQERALISEGIAVAQQKKDKAPIPAPAIVPAPLAPAAAPASVEEKSKKKKSSRVARIRKRKNEKQGSTVTTATAKKDATTATSATSAPPAASAPKPPARVLAIVKAPSQEKLAGAFPVDAKTLAVSPFGERGNTEKTKYLRKALAAMIITDLSKAQGIQVVERVRVQKILDELKLGQSGIVDSATSPRVGRLLGAGKIVSGNMLGSGSDNLHILRIMTNVSTGKELGNQDAQGKVDEFFKLQKAIVFGILKDMGIQLAAREEEMINRYATSHYKSLLLYGEGLDWQDMGEWDKAVKVFEQCILIDPIGPCGPALAGAPSSGDAAAGSGDISAAVGQALSDDAAAAAATESESGGGGGGGGC